MASVSCGSVSYKCQRIKSPAAVAVDQKCFVRIRTQSSPPASKKSESGARAAHEKTRREFGPDRGARSHGRLARAIQLF
jgi:hypothetical protein